jgi:hypothetical protein
MNPSRSVDALVRVRRVCCKVLLDFSTGKITVPQAKKRLEAIERAAYKTDPTAEPDGEITYAVASAFEHIQEIGCSRMYQAAEETT